MEVLHLSIMFAEVVYIIIINNNNNNNNNVLFNQAKFKTFSTTQPDLEIIHKMIKIIIFGDLLPY